MKPLLLLHELLLVTSASVYNKKLKNWGGHSIADILAGGNLYEKRSSEVLALLLQDLVPKAPVAFFYARPGDSVCHIELGHKSAVIEKPASIDPVYFFGSLNMS